MTRASRVVTMAIAAVLSIPAAATEQPRVQVVTSQHATIWPAGNLARFRFCSRASIAPGSHSWTPTWKDIARFETSMPWLMAEWRQRNEHRGILAPDQFERLDWRTRWNRNYAGVLRDGRRLLYVDFAPIPNADGFSICDGGPAFFGIEYDSVTRRIVTIAANGVA